MDKPLPGGPAPGPSASNGQRLVTAALVVGPLLAVAAAVPLLWGRVLHPRDVVLAVVLYAVTGHGVTVGFHTPTWAGSSGPTTRRRSASLPTC